MRKPKPKLRPLAVATVVICLLSALVSAPAAGASADVRLYLPEPTGPYPTGTTRLHLVDEKRTDDLAPTPRDRELMVQLWYPAVPVGTKAPYAPTHEAAGLQEYYPVPAGGFSEAVTHSRANAPAIPGRYPVVLMYHGLCAARTDTTAINEELASRGFVVVAIGSTYEAWKVEFPGGRVASTSDPEFCGAASGDIESPKNLALLNKLQRVRVGDVSFVLDELERRPRELPRFLGRSLALDEVGIFGHSMGGATAAWATAADKRIRAGANLDGLFVGPVRKTGLKKPFLIMASEYHHTTLPDPTWADVLPKLDGWHRWLRLRQAGHYRFVDLGGSAEQWNLRATMGPDAWQANFGDIDDHRSQQIVIRYTTAFFERFLKGQREPLLDKPSAKYPEVEFRATSSAG
ncbi:alpha/beta hydrolase family protein [Tenggerimyces flavus]|uniref:Alpha/beta hydrolase family protein n=1 Tax=Tenggerimyces flavus TaxID=1708749 RepID=A0ABV7YE87_9ACTN|nr:hypothetical protein [Tenggerimyces flavus]MBM7786171.1 dienelactone hydrolase [Tenggerimyces flavus]